MGRLGRALEQIWMRRLDHPTTIDAVLRHPAFRDRAVLEKALSRRFFYPFEHQEVVEGSRFEARSRWSHAALAALPLARVEVAAERAFAAEVTPCTTESLLDSVRRTVARATVDLALGDDAFVPLVQRVVTDIDRGIKMVGRADRALRAELATALLRHLVEPDPWRGTTYLTVAKEQALALPLQDRVDHMAAVFLATGTIQVTDVVTHALIALAQHPEHTGARDEAVIAETIRLFPVNSSITRRAALDVEIDGRRFARQTPITIVPRLLQRASAAFAPGLEADARSPGSMDWAFGVGPRSCPARQVATTLATALLRRFRSFGVEIEPGYRHRRSLALEVRARIGPGAAVASTPPHRRAWTHARFVMACVESYPSAFIDGLPELVQAEASGGQRGG